MRAARMRAVGAALCLVAGITWVAPAASPVHAATIRNVPSDYATIQAAIDAADPGDTIAVAPGTYEGHSSLDKSLTIESTGGAGSTTLDGKADGFPIIAAALTTGETLTVRGFHFLHGQASIDDVGGGLKLTGAGGATVSQNVFEYNNAPDAGGAIYADLSGTLTIERNTFLRSSANEGGAIWMSDPAATTSIHNNVFLYNSAYNDFGASVYWESASATNGPLIRSNTFVGGFGSHSYEIAGLGALDGAAIRNNIVDVDSSFPAIFCNHTTLFPPTFTTNDVWNTGSGVRYGGNCSSADAPTDLNVDPVFADPDWDDVHLRADSPLIDAGTADAGVTTDIDGDTRPFDGDESGGAQIDIGADEATNPLLITPGSLWFQSTDIGWTKDLVLTLENAGSGDITITDAAISGSHVASFSEVDDACAAELLSVNESCTVTLRFTPIVPGVAEAILTITGPGEVGTHVVHLAGDGLDPVYLDPDAYPDTAVGATSTGGLGIYNQSTTHAITLTGLALTGDNASDFAFTSQACVGTPIPAGGSCNVPMSFTPHGAGDREAQAVTTFAAPVGERQVFVGGRGVAPTTPVTWAAPTKPGSSYAWNFGNALARTVRDGSQRLHQAYATDRISGTWAKDTGPYAGIYYTRSTTGSTWTTPRRITSTSRHVVRFGLAAAGSRVYAAYATQTKIVNYSGSAPRVLYVRVNTNHGHGDYWRSSVRLTGTTGRVDFPTVAASGTDVHIAFTNANNGDIIVATSKDRGVTWVKRTVGSSTYNTTSGRAGLPSVAVSGSTVAVTWIADGNGAIRTRVSTDRGSTWGGTEEHTTFSSGELHTAVLGSRVGVAWTGEDGVFTRIRTSGSWADARQAATAANFSAYSPAIALQGTARVAISWAEHTATTNWIALRYAESTNDGVAWYRPQTIASTSTSTRRANDYPSIVWPSTGTRYVSWNGWTSGTSSYRIYLRKGTGTPAGLAQVAPVATTAGGEVTPASVLRVPKADGTRPR
jgi:predicted outer membrane repeat protein